MNSYPKRLAKGIETIATTLDGTPDSAISQVISVIRN